MTSGARRHLQRCDSTGKVRFRDRAEAIQALHRAATSRHFCTLDAVVSVRRERRSYRCRSCRGWHLTSQAYRPPPADPPADQTRLAG